MMNFYFNIKKNILFFLFGIISFSFYGCDDFNPLDFNVFSVSDDKELGKQIDVQITSNQQEYPILNQPSATTYVQNIVNQIINSPEIEYKGVFDYRVKIIRKDNVVNAFATPGGYIYVYTGLLKFVDNEATLAGILAHEVAHAERRHSTKRMTKAYGVQFLLDLLLGENPDQFAEIAANLFTGLAFLKNSRDDEYEADEYSFKYLQSSIWYPGAMKYFFQKVGDNSGNSFLEGLLSTHPLNEDRIAQYEILISNAKLAPPNENNLFSNRYIQFKNTLP
ncbi:MAG: M48 family metalloprotease [Ignavibacteriae bacterium]|nr:M48 family metalloprotease [Ignavibacteriota bacterium]